MKVLPQWLASIAFLGALDVSPLNLIGAGLVLLAAVLWTWSESGAAPPLCGLCTRRVGAGAATLTLLRHAAPLEADAPTTDGEAPKPPIAVTVPSSVVVSVAPLTFVGADGPVARRMSVDGGGAAAA